MEQGKQHRRLDQILLEKGLITEEQLMGALARQKRSGGRVGLHLLLLKYIEEADLVEALATQFQCRGVVLGGLEIPKEIIKLIPMRVAIARKVLPFDYNPDENTLRVACESPNDNELISELQFVARGKQVKLFMAAELPLINAIAHYYMGLDINPDTPFVELPPLEFEKRVRKNKPAPPQLERTTVGNGKSALIVCDDSEVTNSMTRLLKQGEYEVVAVKTAKEAVSLIDTCQFKVAFIKDSVIGSHLELFDRLRKVSPVTKVQYFSSCTDLILPDRQTATDSDLSLKNLQLFTSLLGSLDDGVVSSGNLVGKYVFDLCERLKLQPKDILIITNAAYLCNLAQHYYGQNYTFKERQEALAMTVRLLDSLDYPPIVSNILRMTYNDLKEQHVAHLPVEVVGANIITVVDHFLETHSGDDQLSFNKLEVARRSYKLLEGKLFLSEIVEAFFEMLNDQILRSSSESVQSQVLLYASDPDHLNLLERRTKSAGFRTISECETDGLIELYIRSLPDMIVLYCSGEEEETIALVDQLISRGMDFAKVPTFLLTAGPLVTQPQPLLDKGIAEVLPSHDRINLLTVRLNQAHQKARPVEHPLENSENAEQSEKANSL